MPGIMVLAPKFCHRFYLQGQKWHSPGKIDANEAGITTHRWGSAIP
jgi:hypothetical protein